MPFLQNVQYTIFSNTHTHTHTHTHTYIYIYIYTVTLLCFIKYYFILTMYSVLQINWDEAHLLKRLILFNNNT